MVSTMDLFPAFCRAAGVRPPDGADARAGATHGRSGRGTDSDAA